MVTGQMPTLFARNLQQFFLDITLRDAVGLIGMRTYFADMVYAWAKQLLQRSWNKMMDYDMWVCMPQCVHFGPIIQVK